MSQSISSRFIQLAVATACVAMLTACGGGSDDDKSSSSPQPTNPSNPDSDKLEVAGNFEPKPVKLDNRANEIDAQNPPTATPQTYLYFKTNRSTQLIDGWKYTSGQDFGYDIGGYAYFSDINQFEDSKDKQYKAKTFLSNQVVMGCEGDTWQQTFVVAVGAQAVDDLEELNGKSYTSYSCEPGEFNGYEANQKIAAGFVEVVNNGNTDKIPVAELFGSKGFNDGDDTFYYKAYKVGSMIFAVGHDSNNRGISLKIQDSQ